MAQFAWQMRGKVPGLSMTPDELRAAIEELGLAHREFAFRVRVTPETVSRWINGKKPIPYWLTWKLELMRKERADG